MSDKSINSGTFFPQWMKTKIGDRYDLEQVTFSPPSEDDSFFFIRNPFSSSTAANAAKPPAPTSNDMATTTAIPKSQPSIRRSSTAPTTQLSSMETTANPSPIIAPIAAAPSVNTASSSGGGALSDVINGKLFSYLFSDRSAHADKATAVAAATAATVPAKPTIPTIEVDAKTYHRTRRDSKSCPASPKTSPKAFRRNPYFTEPFRRSQDTLDGKQNWFFNMLNYTKSSEDVTGSDPEYDPKDNAPYFMREVNGKYVLEPKPSEFRELNCWTPISM